MAKIKITNSDGTIVESNEFNLGGGGAEDPSIYVATNCALYSDQVSIDFTFASNVGTQIKVGDIIINKNPDQYIPYIFYEVRDVISSDDYHAVVDADPASDLSITNTQRKSLLTIVFNVVDPNVPSSDTNRDYVYVPITLKYIINKSKSATTKYFNSFSALQSFYDIDLTAITPISISAPFKSLGSSREYTSLATQFQSFLQFTSFSSDLTFMFAYTYSGTSGVAQSSTMVQAKTKLATGNYIYTVLEDI